jgi:hypothetical protein
MLLKLLCKMLSSEIHLYMPCILLGVMLFLVFDELSTPRTQGLSHHVARVVLGL